MDEEIAEVVRKHGWYAASISDHQPPFLYTIGLTESFCHPELIVFGLEPDNAHALFSGLVQAIRHGRSFAEPGVQNVSLDSGEYRVGFRRVHPTQHPLYLGFAMGFCRHISRELEAVQVFWPDSSGKFPFDVGSDVYQVQPRLDIGLTPSEIRQFRRQWE